MKVVNKQVKIEIKSATLEFNQEELEFLRDVVNMIGGDPIASRRRIAVALRYSLASIGLDVEPKGDAYDRDGSIYFLDAKEVAAKKKKTYKGMTRFDGDDEIPY